MTSLLQFDKVGMRATAGVVEILKDLSFAIAKGDFVALVGSSGSGKTSLLRLINRLGETTNGTIFLEGRDIRQLPVVSLRRQVALVNQESRLLGMCVKAALGYPLVLQGLAAETIEQRVMYWASQLNIPGEWMERDSVKLSLGQRQRVAIARTLITEPKIVLLDEPTSSQDVGYSEFLLSRLAEWCQQGKLTVIMANHQIDLAERHVSRLLHLEAGRLIADKTASRVDWAQLREQLVAAERQAQEEWS